VASLRVNGKAAHRDRLAARGDERQRPRDARLPWLALEDRREPERSEHPRQSRNHVRDHDAEGRLIIEAYFSVSAMQLFRYSTSIYGGNDVLIGASWDLLPWVVVAGAVVIVMHAVIKALTSRRTDRVK
jgi:hypothetical protein